MFKKLFCLAVCLFLVIEFLPAGKQSEKNLTGKPHEGEKMTNSNTDQNPTSAVFDQEGFSYQKISPEIESRITGKSFRLNSDIALSELRYVQIKYIDFYGNEKDGELIVNRVIAKATVQIFYELYKHRYPLQEVSLIDKYDADDERSMNANNTTCFNYRKIAGSKKLSQHALGMAIDINPQINPYVKGTAVKPSSGKPYAQRDPDKCTGEYAAYIIQKNDFIYKLFKKHGFTWGGDWNSLKDYQHFEK